MAVQERPGAVRRAAPTATRRRYHPLLSARLEVLFGILSSHGGVRLREFDRLALMLFCGTLRWPLQVIEAARMRRKRIPLSDLPAPVFVVGHWRSGTTLLHNLLACDPRFIYPTMFEVYHPNDFLPTLASNLGRWALQRRLPPTRLIDDMPFRLDLPQEEELATATLGAPSLFNCFYFPRDLHGTFRREVLLEADPETVERWQRLYVEFLERLASFRGGGTLLLKNPANSARIGLLTRMFPGARFIHIRRDPRDVHESTQRLYRALLTEFGLQPWNDADIERHVERAYPLLMRRLLTNLPKLPPGSVADVRYEDLIARPIDTIEAAYRQLGLDGFAENRERFCAYLAASPMRMLPRANSELPDSWRSIARELGYA